MKMLSHVNVAQFIELIEIEEKQKMYIVMELVGGKLHCCVLGHISFYPVCWGVMST